MRTFLRRKILTRRRRYFYQGFSTNIKKLFSLIGTMKERDRKREGTYNYGTEEYYREAKKKITWSERRFMRIY